MSKKILIVEDNLQDQKMIEDILIEAGYEEIQFAFSGEEGVEKTFSEKPDVVVLDTLLPGIDGFETCKRIKEGHGTVIPKVIILTGFHQSVDVLRTKKVNADKFAIKTPDCLELLRALKELLPNE